MQDEELKVLNLSLPEYIASAHKEKLESDMIIVDGHVFKNRYALEETTYNPDKEWGLLRKTIEQQGWWHYKSDIQEAIICFERITALVWRVSVMENGNITSTNLFLMALLEVIKRIKEQPDKYHKCAMF